MANLRLMASVPRYQQRLLLPMWMFPVLLDSMIVCYCGEDSDDFGDYEDSGDGNGEDGDIYLMMQCLSVCHEK